MNLTYLRKKTGSGWTPLPGVQIPPVHHFRAISLLEYLEQLFFSYCRNSPNEFDWLFGHLRYRE